MRGSDRAVETSGAVTRTTAPATTLRSGNPTVSEKFVGVKTLFHLAVLVAGGASRWAAAAEPVALEA